MKQTINYKQQIENRQIFIDQTMINKTSVLININQQMDAVHESQQPHDIGVCPVHNRVYQCYDTQSLCLICPSCLMFGDSKGHVVIRIEEGARNLRAQINSSAKEGLLKFEKTENVLLDIRHVKLSLEENQQNVMKLAENSFDEIILAMKSRKAKFLKQLQTQFSQQISKVEAAQNDWLEKQQISQKILELQKSNDDVKIIEEARYIVEGLQRLAKPLEYTEVRLVEGIKNHLEINKHSYNFKQFKEGIKQFVQKGEQVSNQLRC